MEALYMVNKNLNNVNIFDYMDEHPELDLLLTVGSNFFNCNKIHSNRSFIKMVAIGHFLTGGYTCYDLATKLALSPEIVNTAQFISNSNDKDKYMDVICSWAYDVIDSMESAYPDLCFDYESG
jgi:hypothetical protein